MLPRLAPKLNQKCITLPPFSPMRVCLATRVFSHSVSCEILLHVSFNSLPAAAVHTAELLQKFDELFDIFNSSVFGSPKQCRRPIPDKNNHFEKQFYRTF